MKIPLRVTVRAMMAMVLIMAVGLGWIVNGARTQRLAVEAIERAGGEVFYEWDTDSRRFPDNEPKPRGGLSTGSASTTSAPSLMSLGPDQNSRTMT